ncbi:TetR-like C-terminal domain-containing protein [Glycomyces niveus]|uniref:TetR/AcrR family transcriptional regulator n=1 Tax=Glycomyces niveus TaxID=2820287 RepID=A0ABS3U1H1_9ACTN|nr:TetR/AcrR family transcriptional regulator [Glycomyces sp. NEAU-S30]MBO3732628.1 TetR/AcrR family transcriptional regulator [Glycomyces sp. NEAU-S30]
MTDTRTGRPRDERIDQAVIEATAKLLNEVGYARLTFEAVAARASTSKPALRRRWPSRAHLVVDALAAIVGTAPTPDTGCTRCDLVEGIRTLGAAYPVKIGRTVLPALVADLAGDPELDRVFLERYFHPRRATTAEALRRGIERGDLVPDADIDLLLDLFGATVYYRVLFGHLPVDQDIAERIVDTVLQGVSTPAWRHTHREPSRDR